MRFRTYLAEQYKRKDTVAVDGKDTEEVLPVITIYLLGFELSETKAIALHIINNMTTTKEKNRILYILFLIENEIRR